MKHIFASFLAMLMLLLMVGCSKNVDPYSITLAAEDDDYTESTISPPAEITFDRLTVCEGDDYNIIIRGINPDSPEGYVLSLDISNQAEQTEVSQNVYIYETDDEGEKHIVGEENIVSYIGLAYVFSVDSAVVNGTEVAVSFTTRLSAGDRSFDHIVLDKAALDGLGTITEIKLVFNVYADGTEDQTPSKLSATIYPYGVPDSWE